jgi:exopolyphosphatase/guanosine-5'-triphosphate,3'-diphosphate pyrophosphatase
MADSGNGGRPVAVIDVGATAIRMVIAEIDETGRAHPLESLQQGVHLGKDTFTKGRIQPATIEECVTILRDYRRVMREYGVTKPDQIRAVATSSVREAENRDAFLDRVYTATQIDLEAIEEPEVTRLTYVAVQDVLREQPLFATGQLLIVEVGGGSTELLLVQQGNVTYSNTYGLGSLRMREQLETYRAPADRLRQILDQDISRTVDDIRRNVPVETAVPCIVAVSGDARFAAAQLVPHWESVDCATVAAKHLAKLADEIAVVPVDELVRKFGLPYQEAETVGPTLLIYNRLAQVFKARKFLIPKSSLRDGLLREMAAREHWTKEFSEQVIRSALTLAERCRCDEAHATHVAALSLQLFRELQPEHQLGKRFELLLQVAALLHEIGMFISNRSYHKHTQYMIMHSDLFGLTKEDMLLIALMARYHRRAGPRPYHEGYVNLDRDDRIAVAKCAAILRVADALDSSDKQIVRHLTFSREPGQFLVTVAGVEDLTLERLALKQKGTMFEDVYGLRCVLREAGAPGGGRG